MCLVSVKFSRMCAMCDNYVTAALSGSGYAPVVVTIADLRSVIITHQSTGAWQMTRGSESPPSLMMFSQRSSSVILTPLLMMISQRASSVILKASWFRSASVCGHVMMVVMLWESGLGPASAVTRPGVAHALNINTRRDHSFRNEFSVILLKVSKTRCILVEYEGLFFGTILIQYY